MTFPSRLALLITASAVLTACGESANLPFQAGVGPTPQLPEPSTSLIPTLKVSKAVGWPAQVQPTAPDGFTVTALADNLDHPRWVYTLPNGDVLVAESNHPPMPAGATDGGSGVLAWARSTAMGIVMSRVGADAPSANRITLLRDADHDGHAEVRSEFLSGLTSPFGMALVGNELYIGNADAVVKVPYTQGQTHIDATPVKVTDLPAGINHHWTKNLLANPEGTRLYITVGSNSNVGENGLDAEEGRAAIWELNLASGAKRLFASGLRNPNGLAWKPGSTQLWTVVNERDEIGSDLVPDYLTSVQDGAFYGWPWSYYGGHVDVRVQPPRPDKVAEAIAPDYALGTHVAPLGLTFSAARGMPAAFANGVFIGEHGSWNRNPQAGYKVVFIAFKDGQPSGPPVDFLTGFLNAAGEAQGRPVGVTLDGQGALLVADDVGNTVWRVAQRKP